LVVQPHTEMVRSHYAPKVNKQLTHGDENYGRNRSLLNGVNPQALSGGSHYLVAESRLTASF